MTVIEISTDEEVEVEILEVVKTDYKRLSKKRFFFNWKDEKGQEIYKLQIVSNQDIIGLVSIERIPLEWRIHIRLLTVSSENRGRGKKYENIVGNLLCYVAKISIKEYAELSCVSLKPKSEITVHYIDKYGMNITGGTLSVELREILKLLETYDHD